MTLLALWMGGFPVLGAIVGIVGVSFRRVRQALVWPAAVYSAAVFVYGLFAGGPNGNGYITNLNAIGVAVVVAVSVLSVAPIFAARSMSQSALCRRDAGNGTVDPRLHSGARAMGSRSLLRAGRHHRRVRREKLRGSLGGSPSKEALER